MSRNFDLMQELERDHKSHASRAFDPQTATAHADRDARPPLVAAKSSVSVADLATSHWRLILVCALIGVVLGGLVTVIMPKKYAAEVQFLVKNERQDLNITPSSNSPSPQTSELSEEQVNSELHMLLSHDLLEQLVLSDHLYRPYLKNGQVGPDGRATALAVMKLEKNLAVTAIRKTNVIQANYVSSNPTLAAQVMSDFSRLYLNAHLTAHSTPGSFSFFSGELAGYKNALSKAEQATSQFRQSSRIFNAEQQRAALISQLEDVDARLQNAQADTREQRARLDTAMAEDEAASARIPTDTRTSVNQLTIDHLQTELADMENRRIGMLVKFKPGDRAVQELEGEIANTRKNLTEARTEYAAETTTTVNPLHQTLAAQKSNYRIDLSSLTARKAALSIMQKSYLAQLNEFDNNAVTLANLERDQELAQQNYINYTKRFDEARLADQMDKEKFANVVMIETPFASPLPVSPKALPNLAAGLMLGAMVGLGFAFFSSYRAGNLQGVAR